MRIRTILASAAIAATSLALVAGPAAADHTKGKKYLDVELTRDAAIAADDGFGVAPEGSSGEGAVYLNHGKERFCAFLDFTLPEGTQVAALHLHEKAEGAQNGGVVIDLGPLLAEDGQSSRGCVTGDREFLRGVLSEPDEYYVNAHIVGDGIPAGEIPVIRTEFGQN